MSLAVDESGIPAADAYLIALDVDGTLVGYDGALSEAVRDAVQGVAGAGHHVVISTGRSVAGTLPVLDSLSLTSGYAVCANGSMILRLDPEYDSGWEAVQVTTFDPRAALLRLREIAPMSRFMIEDGDLHRWVTQAFPNNELSGAIDTMPFEEMLDKRVTRIVMRDPTKTAAEFDDVVEASGLHGVSYSVGWTAWLDIAPEGVSKASALETVRDWLQIDAGHTFAAGDGTNDLEMIRWAGRSVAMGQAPDVLKEAAAEITGTIDQDGLVDVLGPYL
ncbi:HAD family hydrolase [Spelaeicoccus albus]|uniref:Cof subfamily protein (Haloacid dehalogenase superfamily) n=1 Tax=Spelaeicoccus albus TaxID=1280376 RepID=A0A7Z0D219_9MICO|nr:HAD family hydrolase [Spelaeicoccus albus]NYI67419.1 Cof subfamily protein (haloacid dehalogenase superfamily) [Spelaeicoccus albus]